MSLSSGHHRIEIMIAGATKRNETISSIVFLNLSKCFTDILGDIDTIQRYFPTAVFVLYGDESENKRFKKELTHHQSSKFDHYFMLHKTIGHGKEFESNTRKILDEARRIAIQKRNSRSKELSSNRIKILVVFANPDDTDQLRLGKEDKIIRECLTLGKHREKIVLNIKHAATIHDVRRAILEDEYDIVQFSGHGTTEGLVLENEMGEMHIVPPEAFAEFVSAHSPPIKCTLLNACYSEAQGQLISHAVPYTIAMTAPISDESAIEFTRGFYDAIGAGKNIEFAYQEGCRNIKLLGLLNATPPLLFGR